MDEERKTQLEYLDNNVFKGLQNLNTGFDALSIKYFSEPDFKIVLNRIEDLGIGIHGIEPWYRGEFYDVLTMEDFNSNADSARWYWKAFKKFTDLKKDLQYAATYDVPVELLKK
jgi:hypothetical protein